jgi:hypothetical protein
MGWKNCIIEIIFFEPCFASYKDKIGPKITFFSLTHVHVSTYIQGTLPSFNLA